MTSRNHRDEGDGHPLWEAAWLCLHAFGGRHVVGPGRGGAFVQPQGQRPTSGREMSPLFCLVLVAQYFLQLRGRGWPTSHCPCHPQSPTAQACARVTPSLIYPVHQDTFLLSQGLIPTGAGTAPCGTGTALAPVLSLAAPYRMSFVLRLYPGCATYTQYLFTRP